MNDHSTSAVSRAEHYLVAEDVKRLAHYGHVIPMGKGFTRDFMAAHYPGWEWGQLLSAIAKGGLFVPNQGHGGRLADGYSGVLVRLDGTAIADDGSLEHPLKSARFAELGDHPGGAANSGPAQRSDTGDGELSLGSLFEQLQTEGGFLISGEDALKLLADSQKKPAPRKKSGLFKFFRK
jgi:hypothetical protein